MSYTNSTDNYNLPQWIGSDKPTFLGDLNGAFSTIDTAMKANSDEATAATSAANAATSAATAATATANAASTAATNAANVATSAATQAQSADTKATQALSAASDAETAASANTIENLAPAYDATSGTYAVGDLVTFIDAQGHGRLYKCIVAVTVPEAFNINKWDDVTVSECFERKYSLVASVTSDGVKDYATLLTELATQFAIDITKDYELVISNAYGDTRCKVITVVSSAIDATNPRVTFIVTGLNSTYGIYGEKYVASQISGNSAYETYYTTGTYLGYHNNSTTAVPNGITFSIYSND